MVSATLILPTCSDQSYRFNLVSVRIPSGLPAGVLEVFHRDPLLQKCSGGEIVSVGLESLLDAFF